MTTIPADDLARRIRGLVETNSVLAPRTTYRLGGPADVLVDAADVDDLQVVAGFAAEHPDVQLLALGRGSNLVVSDRGFRGLVVHLSDALGGIEAVGGYVVAGGALSLPQLANWTARRGLSGAEFAVGVPGSVGGAVRMNAGAHGQDFAALVEDAEVFDLRKGRLVSHPPAALGFGYRSSALVDGDIVVRARLRLEEAPPETIRATVADFRAHRARTQPGAASNAGSVFKNPPGDWAARLVEAAGLKGFSVRGAEVSRQHANFFIAHAGASSQDVFDLVHEVRRRVLDRFGVSLEPEVRFVGDFATGDAAARKQAG